MRLCAGLLALTTLIACSETPAAAPPPPTTALGGEQTLIRLTGSSLREAVRGRTHLHPRNTVVFECDGAVHTGGDHGPLVSGAYEILDDQVCAKPTVTDETDCFALFRSTDGEYYTAHVARNAPSTRRMRIEIPRRRRHC